MTAPSRILRAMEHWLVRRPARAVWACGLFGLALSATVTVTAGFPPPRVHDEFSYLLAGDTFAAGRLSYPTHPMWRHFETFHVLQAPAYASKYPPAQGLALALGTRLAGRPVVGVWISGALLVAALTWTLFAWVHPRWALWGGIAAALWLAGRHAGFGYWATSLWGGSVAAFGGALVLGGLGRLGGRSTVLASVAVGTGLAVLANSRPFEGLAFALVPMAATAALVASRLRAGDRRSAAGVVAPMTLVLGVAALLTASYNVRVTGDAMKPPYLVYEGAYASGPVFLGQSRPPRPAYRVPEMERFYTTGNGWTAPPDQWREHARRVATSARPVVAYFAPWFALPLFLVLPWSLRRREAIVPLGSAVAVGAALLPTLFPWQPHYAAPAVAALCILLVQAARYLAQVRRGAVRVGRGLVRIVFLCIAGSAATQVGIEALRRHQEDGWAWERRKVEQSLARSGRHLVLVAYGASHLPDHEWVYNRGDIDAAPVVWARSLGDSADTALRRYFRGRTAWRLAVPSDTGPFHLVADTVPER